MRGLILLSLCLLLCGCVVKPPKPTPDVKPDKITSKDVELLVNVLASYAEANADAYESSANESTANAHLRAFQQSSKDGRKTAHTPEVELWQPMIGDEWTEEDGAKLRDRFATAWREVAAKIRSVK